VQSQLAIASGLDQIEIGGGRRRPAEFHRIRAALKLRAGEGKYAEVDLRRALEIARQQEAMSLELRAARNLTRMLASRGERQKAEDLLAPIYDWFTEGFDL
jgi:hypothetical protein